MLETSARLLALLSLLQTHREWTGQELAQRLEVDARTIRRDVDKLRSLGYPVDSARGVAGGYRLGNGGRLPPLLFDDAEAVAVAVGLRSAAATSVAGVGENSVQALVKLEQVLPERLRRRVNALAAATSALDIDVPSVDADMLSVLAEASRDAQRVEFAYTARDATPSERSVDPAALVHSGFNWYLLAFDLVRDDWRTFRVDRIVGAVVIAGRGTRREIPGGDAGTFMRDRRESGMSGERDADPAVVRFHTNAAKLRGQIPRGVASIEPDGSTCIATTRGPWSMKFLVWSALLDVPMEVISPPELVEAAARLVSRLTPSPATSRLVAISSALSETSAPTTRS